MLQLNRRPRNIFKYFTKQSRCALVARTRSGKTWLSRKIQKMYDRVLVIDPKGEYVDRDYIVIHGIDDFFDIEEKLMDVKKFKIVFRFESGDDKPAIMYDICRCLVHHKNMLLVCEEIHMCHNPRAKNVYLEELSTTKAAHDFAIIFTTTKPSAAPQYVFDECEIVIAGPMHGDRELQIMRRLIGGEKTKKLPEMLKRDWVFWSPPDVFFFRT